MRIREWVSTGSRMVGALAIVSALSATACESGGGGPSPGPSSWVCGNGYCETGETAVSCAADCSSGQPAICGNGGCEVGETASNCPADCGTVAHVCGNGVCESSEASNTCPSDCGSVGPVCGDGVCHAGSESYATCPGDCSCYSHSECADSEICLSGDCQPAANRVYQVAVAEASLNFTQNTVDGDSSNPDPFVRVYFPSISDLFGHTSTKSNTLNPVWNEGWDITVTAVGQEIWFCMLDEDAAFDDEVYFQGSVYCKGFENIVDFIRLGQVDMQGTDDINYLTVWIQPK